MEPPEAFPTAFDQPAREDSAASGDGREDLFSKAQRLMERITASRDNPSAAALYTLASMLESEESRYMEEKGYFSLNNERAYHGIGKLRNLIEKNDEFFDLMSRRFLSETRYSITVQAAAARLLLSFSVNQAYVPVFERTVMDNIEKWVMDDTVCLAGYCKLKHDSGDEKPSDSELLQTYSTGLLAVCLVSGDISIEYAHIHGFSAKLMRHLRSCVLGEKSTSHKGSIDMGEKLSSFSSFRGKGESQTLVRQVSETTHIQDGKLLAGESALDQIFERDHGKSIDSHARGKECWLAGGQQFDGLSMGAHADDVDAVGESLWHGGDLHVGKRKFRDCDEFVIGDAVEEFQATSDEDATFLVALKAASTVIDAATAVEMARSSNSIIVMNSKAVEPKIDEENEDYILPDRKSLLHLKEKYCIWCLEILCEHFEVLALILHEKGVDVCLELLQQTSKPPNGSEVVMLLPGVLKLICALAAHGIFAALFVDRGGVQKLIAVPTVAQTFLGLSSFLFTISSLEEIMEHVCALPSDVVHDFVGLALQLLECPHDEVRKNAALFFDASFCFRAVIDSFDVHDGLLKVLGLLHYVASVRSGLASGELTLSEKVIAYYCCSALRQYFGAHLFSLLDSIGLSKSSRTSCKPFDISNETIDAVLLQLQKDRKLGPVFVRAHWPAVKKFLDSDGHITMLELCQAPLPPYYLGYLVSYALGVLHIVTLVPFCRERIVNCTLRNDRKGIAVILDAVNSDESEVIQQALNVLVNLVCPLPSISNKPSPLPQTQQYGTVKTSNLPIVESRERNAELDIPDRVLASSQSEPRERSGESSLSYRCPTIIHGQLPIISGSKTHMPAVPSTLVGDRRISLGIRANSAVLAAQLEQEYHLAREAVCANNGIKVLLDLLQPQRYNCTVISHDRLQALACRVLLGLASDDTIAPTLTKLQVGKRLAELIHD